MARIVQRRAAIQNCCRCPVQQNLCADPPVARGVKCPSHQRQRACKMARGASSQIATTDLLPPWSAIVLDPFITGYYTTERRGYNI